MRIKKLHKDAKLPRYSTDGSSAFDVFSCEEIEWTLNSNTLWTAIIPTGWAFEIPKEHGLFVLSRSGHGFKADTTLSNSVGLLDYDYRGQLIVKLICFGTSKPEIKIGDAIAQCILLKTPKCYFEVVPDLSDTERGEKGFGSTDKS